MKGRPHNSRSGTATVLLGHYFNHNMTVCHGRKIIFSPVDGRLTGSANCEPLDPVILRSTDGGTLVGGEKARIRFSADFFFFFDNKQYAALVKSLVIYV